MKQLIRVLSITALFCLISTKGFSQLSVSYYSSSLSKIGLACDFNNRLWTELRLYSNTDITDITPELVFCFNLVTKEQHNIYLGAGANINYFSGFVMPLGVRFTPFEKHDQFSLHIELEPTLDISDNRLIVQSSWGLDRKSVV